MQKKLSEIQPGERFYRHRESEPRVMIGPCLGGWAVQDGRDGKTKTLYLYDVGEVEYEIIPPTPEPNYRPFANAAEFEPHRDRWVKKSGGASQQRILCTYRSAVGLNTCPR